MALKKATKRIKFTDESVNSYGFWTLNDGIDLTVYEKNPILLWNHIRPSGSSKDQVLPIGVMLELKKETDGFSGLPAFDDTDAFAMSIYEKYEAGVINMSSAGLKPKKFDTTKIMLKDGAPCLSKSQLKEISLCDIGSNENALKLFAEDGTMLNGTIADFVALTNKNENFKFKNMDLKEIAAMLKLADTATLAEVEAAVKLTTEANTKLTADLATATDIITTLKDKVTNMETAQTTDKINTLVDGAVDAKKITAAEASGYKALAAQNFDQVKTLLDGKQGVKNLKDHLADDGLTEAEKLELTQLSAKSGKELFTQNKLERLKDLSFSVFQLKYKEAFKKDYVEA